MITLLLSRLLVIKLTVLFSVTSCNSGRDEGGMKWLVQKEEKTVKMDTYMDTCEQSNNDNPCRSLKS